MEVDDSGTTTPTDANLVNILTQLRAKIEESRPVASSPRGIDSSKICAGDGSYYINLILNMLVNKDEPCVENNSEAESPRKSNEERYKISFGNIVWSFHQAYLLLYLSSSFFRKRKAAEAQKALLAEFASRQTKFMDNIGIINLYFAFGFAIIQI